MILLLATICMITDPNVCKGMTAPVAFPSMKACETWAQPLLAQLKAANPEWEIKRYWCEAEKPPGQEI